MAVADVMEVRYGCTIWFQRRTLKPRSTDAMFAAITKLVVMLIIVAFLSATAAIMEVAAAVTVKI